MTENDSHLISLFRARRNAFDACLLSPEIRAHFQRMGEQPHSTCPCCGYPTLAARAGYDICILCEWEDDGQDDGEFASRAGYFGPDSVAGGPNGDYSLNEARLNFQRYGTMYRPSDMPAFAYQQENAQTHTSLRQAFDALLPILSPQTYIAALPSLRALCGA